MIEMSGWVAEEADGFEASLAIAEHLDIVVAAAIMADDTVSSAPVLDPTPCIRLLHARHPLMLLSERRCVANDVAVDAGATLLVSGPNAGGKTVALKTVGLASLMARAGLHLCAETGSAIGWFGDIRTDIGDAQNLEKDLSTFSGHMINLRDLLATAGTGSLILIDEIAVGTDPEQGAALAQAVLEALADRGITGIVTTHYDRLKNLGTIDRRFANASVGFDLTRLEPTFKLHLGIPGSSGALAVARRMGIAEPIVERARGLLGEVAAVEDLLANVSEQKRRLEEERAAVLAELEALEADRMAARASRDRTRARFERETRSAHGEALSELKSARREIEEVRRELRAKQGAATPDDLKSATRRLVTPGSTVAKHEPKRTPPPGVPATAEQLIAGTPVIVPRLGRAEVVGVLPDDKVEVRVGSMRAVVALADTLLDSHRIARAKNKSNKQVAVPKGPATEPGFGPAPAPKADTLPGVAVSAGVPLAIVEGEPAGGRAGARTQDTTVDIRGNRVDEAMAEVDKFLDESLLASRDIVFIVHGHGTGALRKAVRSHLAGHRAITTFRAGEQNEGGDGVTVAFLKG